MNEYLCSYEDNDVGIGAFDRSGTQIESSKFLINYVKQIPLVCREMNAQNHCVTFSIENDVEFIRRLYQSFCITGSDNSHQLLQHRSKFFYGTSLMAFQDLEMFGFDAYIVLLAGEISISYESKPSITIKPGNQCRLDGIVTVKVLGADASAYVVAYALSRNIVNPDSMDSDLVIESTMSLMPIIIDDLATFCILECLSNIPCTLQVLDKEKSFPRGIKNVIYTAYQENQSFGILWNFLFPKNASNKLPFHLWLPENVFPYVQLPSTYSSLADLFIELCVLYKSLLDPTSALGIGVSRNLSTTEMLGVYSRIDITSETKLLEIGIQHLKLFLLLVHIPNQYSMIHIGSSNRRAVLFGPAKLMNHSAPPTFSIAEDDSNQFCFGYIAPDSSDCESVSSDSTQDGTKYVLLEYEQVTIDYGKKYFNDDGLVEVDFPRKEKDCFRDLAQFNLVPANCSEDPENNPILTNSRTWKSVLMCLL